MKSFYESISYYVGREYRGKGIGSCLIQHALREAPKLGFHNLFPILLDIVHYHLLAVN